MIRKKLNIRSVVLLIICIAVASHINIIAIASAQTEKTQLYQQIKSLHDVLDVKPLKFIAPFKEKYLVELKQWLDANDTAAGWFAQRVYVSHFSYDAPTVIITEGYVGDYAENESYIEEVAKLFHTNQIVVEHRYFGTSKPEKLDWKYLTTTNAAADHHHVTELFKTIYTHKWIATGISKGGETALIYRTLYPNDVDISVCYVAPLSFGVEDGRHEPFIAIQVGNAKDRAKVQEFQMQVLKRKAQMMPLFTAFCNEKHYTFNLPLDEIYDYCVLEFSFSFWQWGWKPVTIPAKKASNLDLFNYLMRVCSPDYFALEEMEPTIAFFVQAAHELGYYGYDIRPFAKYLKITTAKGYLDKIFMPKDYRVAFDSTIAQRCAKFLRDNDPQMIFIYGEYDPWSAAAVSFDHKTNLYKAVCPGGNHGSRISSLPAAMKQEVMGRIEKWLE